MTFRRVWCLSEVVTSIDKARGFEVMLADEEERDLQTTLSERFEMVLEVLSSIDAEKAQATHASDKEMIMGMIRTRPGGVQEFNTAIIGALRAWLLKTAKALLEEDGNEENTGLLTGVGHLGRELGSIPEALTSYTKCLHIDQALHGPDHLEPAKTKVNIGRVYDSMGEYDKALNTYGEALSVLESTLGCDHPLVAATMVL